MQKLWSTDVERVFLESYYFGYFSFWGFPVLETFSLSSRDPLSPLSRVLPLGLPLPTSFVAVRPPPVTPPIPKGSSPPPLSNPPHSLGYLDRRSPETPSIRPTATARGIGVGLLVSGQIGRNTYGDLEAPGQANPAPPLPIKSVAGRRRNE